MIRVAAVIAAVAIALGLLILDIRPWKTIEVSTNFSRPTPYFSALGPPTRVGEENGVQRFFAEPVYFDLRLPRWFSRARVEAVWSKGLGVDDPRLGVALDPSDDRIEGRFALYPMARIEKRGTEVVSAADLDLSALPRSRYGYRLFFSAPGVDRDTPLYLAGVTVRAEREPFLVELRRVIRRRLTL